MARVAVTTGGHSGVTSPQRRATLLAAPLVLSAIGSTAMPASAEELVANPYAKGYQEAEKDDGPGIFDAIGSILQTGLFLVAVGGAAKVGLDLKSSFDNSGEVNFDEDSARAPTEREIMGDAKKKQPFEF